MPKTTLPIEDPPPARAADLDGMLLAIERLPVHAHDLAAAWTLITDSVGCVLGAAATPAAWPALAWSAEQPKGPVPLAWTLGALSNILELDAMHVSSSVHPGTVVVPAALALALALDSPAEALARAVLRGTEAAIRVGCSTGATHRRHFQSTSTCASAGAALACADLLGLQEEAKLDAMGNAMSTAGGLWAFVDEETLTKQWHAGHAAQNGLACAQLAAHGLRGPRHVLGGRRGFHAVLCADAVPGELVRDQPGWQIHATAYKPWPCPRPVHAAITAALALRQRIGGADSIRSIELRTFSMAVDLCHCAMPTTAHEARFSLQYCVAAAIQDGAVDFDTFDAGAIARHRELAGRVVVHADAAMTADYPLQSRAALELALDDGQVVTQDTHHALGDPEQPLDAACRQAKHAALVRLLPQAGRQPATAALQAASAGQAGALEAIRLALRACGVHPSLP